MKHGELSLLNHAIVTSEQANCVTSEQADSGHTQGLEKGSGSGGEIKSEDRKDDRHVQEVAALTLRQAGEQSLTHALSLLRSIKGVIQRLPISNFKFPHLLAVACWLSSSVRVMWTPFHATALVPIHILY
jgi:hypothetical protein